jgi:hypothetical protein
MAESADQPVSANSVQLSEIRQDIGRTRSRLSGTLRAIDHRLGALLHDDGSSAVADVRAREGGMVGIVAAGALAAGRARTQAQRLGVSPRSAALAGAGTIAAIVIVMRLRRRRAR